jgi:ankyrin repeat protein
MTALIVASKNGLLKVMKLLLKAEANVNFQYGEVAYLHNFCTRARGCNFVLV